MKKSKITVILEDIATMVDVKKWTMYLCVFLAGVIAGCFIAY